MKYVQINLFAFLFSLLRTAVYSSSTPLPLCSVSFPPPRKRLNCTNHNCWGKEVWRHNGQVDLLEHQGTTQSQQNKCPHGVNVGCCNCSVHNKHCSARPPRWRNSPAPPAPSILLSSVEKEGTKRFNVFCSVLSLCFFCCSMVVLAGLKYCNNAIAARCVDRLAPTIIRTKSNIPNIEYDARPSVNSRLTICFIPVNRMGKDK